MFFFFFFSSRRRHTRYIGDWSSDVCSSDLIEYHIRKCDTVVPLVAIATPATYVKQPLRVFELDFEANLPIVRACVRHGKRLVFPSTSEVYGMSPDRDFDPEQSPLVYGPIHRHRLI